MSRISWFEKKRIPTYDYIDEIQTGVVEFNNHCTGCGMCAKICLVDAIEIEGKKAIMKPSSDCVFCGCCEAICPKGAVELKKSPNYKYFYKTIERGEAKPPRIAY